MAALASALWALIPAAEGAAAAGSSVGAVASTAAAGTSWLDVMSDGFTAFQGLAALSAGAAGQQSYALQADAEKANARTAVIAGLRKQNDTTDTLIDTLASQRVALAGSGVDLSAGVRDQIFGETFRRAGFSRGQTALDAAIEERSHLLSARGLLAAGSQAMTTGYVNAAGSVGSYLLRRSQRG